MEGIIKMSQDLISDTLNQILNAKRIGKEQVVVKRASKLLLNVLEIAQKYEYIKDFKKTGKSIEIIIGNINNCGAVKPRFNVTRKTLEKYMKRYLPARDFGILLISTNQGVMTHQDSIEKKTGGCLIAYFY
nr:30S ribosomal protein S8 [uncultured archaeon]